MRTLKHELGPVHVPGPRDDLSGLFRLAERSTWWAADTETTGTNQYAADFEVRLVQFGTVDEAWVLDPRFHLDTIAKLTTQGPTTWWHNWVFDAIALEEGLGLGFDAIAERAKDTSIYSRVIDLRGPDRGGVGHSLEQLCAHYLGLDSKRNAKEALKGWARQHKIKIADVWKHVPIDHELYLLYAGQDVLAGSRLARVLSAKVDPSQTWTYFVKVEQPLSRRLALMQRIGMPFDFAWAKHAETEFDEAFDKADTELIEVYGIEPANIYAHSSKNALVKAFHKRGAQWTKKTDKGEVSLDKSVVKELALRTDEVGELARTLASAKGAKHYGDYIRNMRDQVGTDGRIHPNIHPMQAATARMSVSDPPLQQLPRDDVNIRGCLLADPGEVIVCSDYAQMEFRVGAAASRDPVMIRKIKNGEDLHAVTATALFGPGFSKAQRQVAKPVGLGRLYLGSPRGIWQQICESDTTGCVPSLEAVGRATRAFDREFRRYNAWAMDLKRRTEAAGGRLTTLFQRPLIVDRSYAAPNYYIQSSSRDLFAGGITAFHKAGLGDRLRLVMHDEAVLSVRPDEADEVIGEVERALSQVIKGVPIDVESAVKGERWRK